MGFFKNWDVDNIASQLHRMGIEASSSHNDGWTQMACKHELYKLKCLMEDIYQKLPVFEDQEEDWEKERVAELLKRK